MGEYVPQTVTIVDDRVVVHGDIDRIVAARIAALMTAHSITRIDLWGATFIDSDAVGALVQLHDADPRVLIVTASTIVCRALGFNGATHLLSAEPEPVPAEPTPAMQSVIVGNRIVIAGEIDSATMPALVSVIQQNPELHLLDLTDVSFIDSSGLRAIVNAHRHDPKFRIAAASDIARRLLEITGLTYLLE